MGGNVPWASTRARPQASHTVSSLHATTRSALGTQRPSETGLQSESPRTF